jgi:glycosyltransferase involved in cell wall biosynthesis
VDYLQQQDPGGVAEARTIITIVNALSPVSMALNEFVAWRARRFAHESHVVVSLGWRRDSSIDELNLPDNVETVPGAADIASFRREVQSTLVRVAGKTNRAIVHVHYPRSGVWFHSARFGTGANFPVLFTVHNMFAHYPLRTKLISTFNCIRSDHVTVVSHAAWDAFPESLRRLRPGAFSAIPNGVDLDRIDAALAVFEGQKGNRDPDQRPLELVMVAKFTPQKGHDFMLDVLGRLPGVNLTLVGDGQLRAEIEQRVNDDGLSDRVRFTGLVPRERVYTELLNADLVVTPALWEGLPIAVLEAMALRRPMLLSDIEPHREIRREHPTFPLLPFDPSAWVEAIQSYHVRSGESLQAEGNLNREAVERAFTLTRMHDSYTDVYESLLLRNQS